MGLEVSSRGGSLGGLIASLMLVIMLLNQGVSIDSGASKCARCTSGSSAEVGCTSLTWSSETWWPRPLTLPSTTTLPRGYDESLRYAVSIFGISPRQKASTTV